MLKVYRPLEAGFGGQHVESWDHTWEGASLEEALRWAQVSYLRGVFDRYFPQEGRILEGGCGIGQFVLYYHRRGYRIEGVDFSSTTIERLRQQHPELTLRVGDVTALPYPDASFESYYSGGVVEHFEDGPYRALAEARRVLSPRGKLIITVPFLNRLRRVKTSLGWWDRDDTFRGTLAVGRHGFAVEPPPGPGLQFSEYYFTQREFAAILRQAGFAIVEGYPCDVEWGEVCQGLYRLRRRSTVTGHHPGRPLNAGPSTPNNAGGVAIAESRVKRLWKDLFVTENRATLGRRCLLSALSECSGHMLLFVCEPTGSG